MKACHAMCVAATQVKAIIIGLHGTGIGKQSRLVVARGRHIAVIGQVHPSASHSGSLDWTGHNNDDLLTLFESPGAAAALFCSVYTCVGAALRPWWWCLNCGFCLLHIDELLLAFTNYNRLLC